MKKVKWILPVIVISQSCCTSLWFAGNGVMNDLASSFHLNRNALGHLTSAVQFGFIAGTLVFAVLTIADSFSPSRVFFISAMVGAFFNLGTILQDNGFVSLLGFRFLTGFFLAGIYPAGMKIAAIGGLLMLIFIPDGPYRKPTQKLDLSASYKVFRNQKFGSATFN